jgi:hypothetical protein
MDEYARRVDRSEERYDIWCGRPGPYGNQWTHLPWAARAYHGVTLVATREEAIARYAHFLLMNPKLRAKIQLELRGKVLGCACPKSMACHVDLIAFVANS